ncbi:intraflagellar transport protein 70A isoform X1 [Gadus macrocephalus]|uniref:intraflagellar transport protein 70A isoform X1 n=1 Tax=Gadus macrocephalus TaxID=80720 RepID=UPI0028CB3503|nr:intraflagellar transport protein 70A isoform X1 [Gadus macrocephalus]
MTPTVIKDGEYTATIYRLIKECRYGDAIVILNHQLEKHMKSRAALSLLGYCCFHTQDFSTAADCYEQLSLLHPEVEEYRLYHAQALARACCYPEAMKASFLLDNPSTYTRMIKLQAAIKYGEEEYSAAKALVEQLPQEEPDYEVKMGCLLYREEQYEEARRRFTSAQQALGYQPDLSYNMALCYYSMKNYSAALKHIAEIIERGIREHPELSVGMTTEGVEVRSVGNTLTLQQTALIEAFNLKAAVQFQLRNLEGAQDALTDMPPRTDEELDPVTLHNQALLNMERRPSEGFEKLAFLLQQDPFPPVTFGNLLLLYCKYEYFDLAADVLAENAHLTYRFLSPYLYEFLDAMLTCQTAPEEAFRKFDDMNGKLTEQLRKLAKQVQDFRLARDDQGLKKGVQEYDQLLERYIPVLMAQAKIYWSRENFQMVEKIFRKSVEICNEHDTWKLNVAHVLFMQENKYKEAIGFYEPIVKKHYDNILNVSAVVLANLCVSYIMTSQNEEAEELMRKIEKEEEQISYDAPDKKVFHLCIVNLVIGTLYCAKGNYDFGISRVIKSLEPYNKKLGTDTWFYAKRCVLSLLENMSKHMILLRDAVVQDCLLFLERCEVYGREEPAVIQAPLQDERSSSSSSSSLGRNSVTYEARLLKALFYQVIGWNE